jgi:aryl-alcohol dehydrogenase-like predicted oxidoreductase
VFGGFSVESPRLEVNQLAPHEGALPRRRRRHFVSLQAYYSLVGRDLEHELLPLCVEEGLGVLPWSPLAWLLAQPGVASVIIGANRRTQLEDNLKSVELRPTPEELERLSATTAPPAQYPLWMIELQGAGRSPQTKAHGASSAT